MAEMTNFAQFLQSLATTTTPSAQSALIAESAFAKLSPSVALVARRCSILRWFDSTIVAALLPESTANAMAATVEEACEQLAQLPFVEHLPWGLTYHEQTRAGLIERYTTEQPDLLKQTALLAAPAYQQHPDQALAGQEALFCWLVASEVEKAQQLLNDLIRDVGRREDWNSLLAFFGTCDYAATLSFVQPLRYTPFHYYAQGLALRQLGNQEGAITAYQRAITLDEEDASLWNNLGLVYHDQKRYDDALTVYQRAIILDDKYAYPWNNLGLVYRDQRRYDDAIAAFQHAIALDEIFSIPWNNLGLVYRDQRRHDDAIAAFQHAITLDDKYASPWNNLGLVCREQHCYDDAIAAYQQAIALDEKYASAWNNLGNVCREQHCYDDAIAAYQQAIALDEKYAFPWSNLGLTYRILKRWSEAETSIRYALAFESTDWSLWCGLADILRHHDDQARWQEALAQAQPLVNYNNFYDAACFESVAGNVERALALLAQASAEESFDAAWAQVDPDLEWIRHDPRFTQIVKGA